MPKENRCLRRCALYMCEIPFPESCMRGLRHVPSPRRKLIMAGALQCRTRVHGTARDRARGPSPKYQDSRLGELAVHVELLFEMWLDLARQTGQTPGARPRRTRLLGPL